ncbi:MAG: hypothetical protein II393_00355 [Cytophagales bacterium]|nr:hypothetical protein [Cytophagales bacterium]
MNGLTMDFVILYFICMIILIFDSINLGIIKAQLDIIESKLNNEEEN